MITHSHVEMGSAKIDRTVETFETKEVSVALNATLKIQLTRTTNVISDDDGKVGRAVFIEVDVKADVGGERLFFSITPTILGWDNCRLWAVRQIGRNGNKKFVDGKAAIVQLVIEMLNDRSFIDKLMGMQLISIDAEIAELQAKIDALRQDKLELQNGPNLNDQFLQDNGNVVNV